MNEAQSPSGPPEGSGPYDSEARPRLDTIASWHEQGYRDLFQVASGGRILCGPCGEEFLPEQCRVDHSGRYEGVSDPEDEELLLAISCGSCGHRGTLTLAYGPYASADEAEVARRLRDARPQ